MPPIIKLIQAIARLTQAGAIKKVEDAYKLAKRELGERFNEYKENIKDAFNERESIYREFADYIVTNNEGLESCFNKILSVI